MSDPVVAMANRDATREMEGIHTHYNDDIKFEVDSLVGRTSAQRGPPEKIVAAVPLKLADGQLFIDLALIGDFVDDVVAAAGGVPVGGIYRYGSTLKIRVT